MIDAIHTITSTIKNKLDELRFLGKNDTKTFKRIIQTIILTDLIEWCNEKYESLDILMRLAEIRNSIFLKNCGFDIKHTGEASYASVNIPSSNDEWKLVTDAPFVKVVNTYSAPEEVSEKWEPDENYTIKYILVYNLTTVSKTPALDISKFTVHDKMNIYYYIDPKTNKKTFYYLDENCQWHTVSEIVNSGGTSTDTDTITKMLQSLSLQEFKKGNNTLSSGLAYDDGETNWKSEPSGAIQLATDDDIKELFK